MRKIPSLVGMRFGKLVVERQEGSTAAGQRRWLCRCDCGNTHITTASVLKRSPMANCGCLKSPDLTGQVFGRLTVLGRSEKRGARGGRTTPLWECRCSCGATVCKATDSLKNPDESMCAACAGESNSKTARAACGYVAGTQLSRIRDPRTGAANTSGCRGVYYDPKTNRYRARLKFQGKIMSFGSYTNYEDAVKARQRAEEEIFEKFIASIEG